MTEAQGGAWSPIAANDNLLESVLRRGRDSGGAAVAAVRQGDRFVDVTASELVSRIRSVAKGLMASGIAAGDRVALMSATRLEWTICDYAILATGGVTVPVYETSSAEQVQWILSDSGAKLAIVETAAMAALYKDVAAMAPDCGEALVLNEGALDELGKRGTDTADADLDTRLGGVAADGLATIIYTSGTTGRPKGCLLTHGNLRSNTLQSLGAIKQSLGTEEVTLLFLPLAHVLAKIISLACFEGGIKVCYSTGVPQLIEELAITKPTMVVSVPRVFEKVYNTAEGHARADGKGAIFKKAADVASEWSEARSQNRRRLWVEVEHAAFDKLVYGKIRAAFGGRLKLAFSGGGPLGSRLTHFFNGIGVRILEGYGLTETSPTLTANTESAWKPGTVGRPVAGTTIRIADNGEILAKGPQVFSGYWHNPAATADVLSADGWFRTGDLGSIDSDGFLKITGRLKEIIVTAGGKNVAPAPLEDRLRAHPLISQALVVGDNRPFIAALLALEDEVTTAWAGEHGRAGATTADLVEFPELRSTLQLAIDDANRSVSRAESIRAFAILPHDLSLEAGEITPTLKVRRAVVEKRYAEVIEGLYR
ncbi:MAG: AMP-dependent synthetase/ligase [Acidimicrobiales bacterium]